MAEIKQETLRGARLEVTMSLAYPKDVPNWHRQFIMSFRTFEF
jgi:hypothetical protein